MWHPRLFLLILRSLLSKTEGMCGKSFQINIRVTYKESEENILVVTAVNKNKVWR